ncbi:MAG: hypothetical protein KBC57_12150 [Neisseriaceae bacterium]|nr:hypothetical protein [Neisseriaceae bacterium]
MGFLFFGCVTGNEADGLASIMVGVSHHKVASVGLALTHIDWILQDAV